MIRLLIVASLLTVPALPVAGQQLQDLSSATLGISPADPALSGIILDTVVPMYPNTGLGAPRLITPGSVLDLSTPASGIGYEYRLGSTYRWWRNGTGETRVRGTNLRSWSKWYGTIRPSGLMSGFDGDMNFWRYNLETGVYTNTTTGEICVGQGATGRCAP
jgi:hypothetical protein